MQGGVGNDDAADVDRFQIRHRGEGAGAPDLDADAADGCQRLFGRKFVRHRPARGAGKKAQPFLQDNVVDFVYHAVDVIGKGSANFRQSGKKRFDFFNVTAQPVVRIDGKAPFFQMHEKVFL